MVSSKKLGRMVTADVDKALANIDADTPMPDMKSGNVDFAKAVAPKKTETFAEAFRAARARGDKTFSWAGKPGMKFTTKLASEDAKRPAATRRPAASKSADDVSDNTKKFFSKLPSGIETKAVDTRFTGKSGNAPLRAAPGANQSPTAARDARRAKLSEFISKAASIYTPRADQEPWIMVGDQAREANRRDGTIGGYKKGGKIDGCAVRGKTRAMRKK